MTDSSPREFSGAVNPHFPSRGPQTERLELPTDGHSALSGSRPAPSPTSGEGSGARCDAETEAGIAQIVRACAWSTLIGWQDELGDRIDYICDQIARKVALAGEPQAACSRRGIYIASKVKHADRWRFMRDKVGEPIISTWIDEAGEGETSDHHDLWRRCITEASNCELLIVYREPEEVLKGAWVELGCALTNNVPVFAVGLDEYTIAKYRGIRHFRTMKEAMTESRALLRASSLSRPNEPGPQMSEEAFTEDRPYAQLSAEWPTKEVRALSEAVEREALEQIALLDEADGHELTADHARQAVAIATSTIGKHPSEILASRVSRPHQPGGAS
jgi:hypothetical protein